MSSRIRAHLRSHIVGYLALFVALSGTAVALPGANRIDRNDLRPRVVKPINIQRNAVRPWQLAPFAVRPFHIAGRGASLLPASGHERLDKGALSSGFELVGSTTVTTTRTSRIAATASLEIDSNGGDNDNVVCRIDEGPNEISDRQSHDSPDTVFDVMTTAIAGRSEVKPPGTYTIAVLCSEVAGTIDSVRGDLVAWEVAS